MGAPKVSVVVPVYNAADTLPACLAGLSRQTVPADDYEVIVVDDGSTDGTAEVARAAGARVIQQANAGPAAARNRGAATARGELLLFTDGDCEPLPGWMAAFMRAFADPEVMAAKGTYATRQRALMPRFVQVEYEERYHITRRAATVDFIDTYSAAYRRQVFLDNGGFDVTFPKASVEDQEFSFRLNRKGYKMVFVPEAQVYHRHPASLVAYLRRKYKVGFWKVWVMRRYPERVVRDSHTPQTLKLQVLLLPLLAVSLPLALLIPRLRWLPLALAAAFLVATLPFLAHAVRRDAPVALVSPPLLAGRAAALGLGYLVGLLRRSRDTSALPRGPSAWHLLAKRTLDVVGASVGLLLSAPLFPLIALFIKLDSPGPVFFVQERVGQHGRTFRMVKFRTMRHDPDGTHDAEVEAARLQQPNFKLAQDPRVTRVGRFLRRSSLDEAPQFWNVLKGDMSLVGPRPEEVRIVAMYRDWHRQRLAVRPGITGPMQINGRGDLALDQRVQMELDYIGRYSLWRDIQILARTIPAIVRGEGAR